MADLNSFLSPCESLPIAPGYKYLRKFSNFIMKLCVLYIDYDRLIEVIKISTLNIPLSHCRLNRLSLTITLFIGGVQFQFRVRPAMKFSYSQRKMDKLLANSEDPDQTPRSAASDLGLHCLPITLLGSPNYNGLINTHNIFSWRN